MTRALTLGLLALLSSCAPLEATTRTERGPLLRTYTRPQVLTGGATAEVRAQWPTLKLTVSAHDTCRAEAVEAYAEERITERTARPAGPALATGIANVLAAGVLFGVSLAVSGVPNVSVIDEAGRYGASTRQYVQGASLVTLLVGVPALVVGLVGVARSGTEVELQTSEQVVSQRDARCNERPAEGAVTLLGSRGVVARGLARDGAVDFDAAALLGAPESIQLEGADVQLDDDARAVLWGFGACAQLARSGERPLDALGEGELLARAEALRQCRVVRGAEVSGAIRAVDDELALRRGSGAPGAFAPGAGVESYEDAVSAYAPRLTLEPGSPDLAALDAPEPLDGKPVLLRGVVVEGLAENIGVVQVGPRQLYVFIPPRRAWGGDFGNGTRVEAVAVMAGTQTVGERTLPLARAVWMRPAY